MFINRYMDTQILIFSYNTNKKELRNKKEQITNPFMNMEEFQKQVLSKRQQAYIQKEYTLYGFHLHEILEKAQLIYSDIKQISNCEGPVVGVR